MNTNKLTNDLEKVTKQIELLKKKEAAMGLTGEESKKLKILLIKYVKLDYKLLDTVFEDTIVNIMNTEDTVLLKQELYSYLHWCGELILDETLFDEIIIFYNKSKFKTRIKALIKELYNAEKKELSLYENDEDNKEMLDLVIALLRENQKYNTLQEYLKLKYKIVSDMLNIKLEDDNNETIN